MAKKKRIPLDKMMREELIQKCENQREQIKTLNQVLQSRQKELELYKVCFSERPLNSKLQICMEETLAYMDEIEKLKKRRKY